MHQRQRLWMLAGTGEGPVLAAELLQRGWRLRVSLVTAAAAHTYRRLLEDWGTNRLELAVGALDGDAAIALALQQARSQHEPFSAVVDATHPFAQQISPALARACVAEQVPLLRLQRELLSAAGAVLLPRLGDLAGVNLQGVPLLLALGGRQLAAAVAFSAGALHHARVLPAPGALQLALAAGLLPERIACLRPKSDFAVEAALVRHWGIGAIVCRQSGGLTEAGWYQVSQLSGARLLLLKRPGAGHSPDAVPVAALPFAALLAKLDTLTPADGFANAQPH